MIRRLLKLAGFGSLLALAMMLVGGCTMTESRAQAAHRREMSLDYDARQLVEDIDTFLLLDRNSRLTRWHVP
jgi:hypothetical protein